MWTAIWLATASYVLPAPAVNVPEPFSWSPDVISCGRVCGEAGLEGRLLAAAGCTAADVLGIAERIAQSSDARMTLISARTRLDNACRRLYEVNSALELSPSSDELKTERNRLIGERADAIAALQHAQAVLLSSGLDGLGGDKAALINRALHARAQGVSAAVRVTVPSDADYGRLRAALIERSRARRVGRELSRRGQAALSSVNFDAVADANRRADALLPEVRATFARTVSTDTRR